MVGHRVRVEGCTTQRSSSEDLFCEDGAGTGALEANILVNILQNMQFKR